MSACIHGAKFPVWCEQCGYTNTVSGHGNVTINAYTTSEAVKHDTEKPDLSLVPKEFLEAVAQAFMHGEKKYGRYNYLNGMEWHRLTSAIKYLRKKVAE